ncbi:MAG: hypothetical protein ABIR30_04755 [Chitinophagaceae bacterium]
MKRVISRVIACCAIFFSCFSATAQYGEDTVVAVDEIAADTLYKDILDTTVNYTGDDQELFLKNYQYEGDSFSVKQRNVPDSLVKALQEKDEFWYANTVIKKEEKKEEPIEPYTPISQRSWFQTLVWLVIIGGFAAFLMIYLSGNNIGLFRKKKFLTTEEDSGEMPEDIFAISYEKEIEKAAALGNYRLAVRLMFLRLLKNMAERNVISYQQDRTNFDYLLQLQPTKYYTDFFRITRNYEYSWYGQFDVSEDAYHIIRNDFDQFEKGFR